MSGSGRYFVSEDPRFGDYGETWSEEELLETTRMKTIEEVLTEYEIYELSDEEALRIEQRKDETG